MSRTSAAIGAAVLAMGALSWWMLSSPPAVRVDPVTPSGVEAGP